MSNEEFIECVLSNPVNKCLVERLGELGLKDCWLVSGCLFQTAWNILTGRPVTYGIVDYDIAYYDACRVSWQEEDRVIKKVAALFPEVSENIQVRNQARVHLWYSDKFDKPYPALISSTQSIDRYLAVASMVGVRIEKNRRPILYAPRTLADINSLQIRPNLTTNFSAVAYMEKARRWKKNWPELTLWSPEAA